MTDLTMSADELRDRVIALWDANGAWIPGADYERLAEILGVPAERLLSRRQGGQSSQSPGPLLVELWELRRGDVFTTDNSADVPFGAEIHHVTHQVLGQVAVVDRNGFSLLRGDADRAVWVTR